MNRREFCQTSAALFAALGIKLPATTAAKTIDLSQFCDPDPWRYDFTRPWTLDGWKIATDSRIMLRVPTSDPNDIVEFGGDFVRVGDSEKRLPFKQRLMPWRDCESAATPWPSVDLCDGPYDCPRHKPVKKRCDFCDVFGGTKWCDCCDRTGETIVGACSFCGTMQGDMIGQCHQRVGNHQIHVRYDAMIRQLQNVRWQPTSVEEAPCFGAIAFRFNGGQGFVMPCTLEEGWDKGLQRYPGPLCKGAL